MIKIVPLLCTLVLATPPAPARTDRTCTLSLPANIDAPDHLRRRMGEMLRRSATFRQQCLRLETPGLRVQIRTDALLVDGPYRARSVIHRSDTGHLSAWVRITPFGDPTQWLAHEIEHIIEQLDGMSIPRLAAARAGDAWRTGDNMFETERAIRVGLLVLREVRDGGRELAHAAAVMETSGRGD
jgi:hypothetical protein